MLTNIVAVLMTICNRRNSEYNTLSKQLWVRMIFY